MAVGWALVVDAAPYIFTSQGAASDPTSSSASWPTNFSNAQGVFDWEGSKLQWSERMRPIDGDLDVSEMTFRLHDAQVSIGPAGGLGIGVCSYLFARDTSSITTTTLQVSCSASATSITVADGGAFGAAPFSIWIERECLRVTLITGNVWTVTRGYLGSQATAHTVNSEFGIFPEVWSAFNWATARRVSLFSLDESVVPPVAYLEWTGYCQRAPRLADNGVDYELQCTQAWNIERESSFVNPNAQCRLRGFNATGIALAVSIPGERITFGFWQSSSFSSERPQISHVHDDLDSALTEASQATRAYLNFVATAGHITQINRCEAWTVGDSVYFGVSVNWGTFFTASTIGASITFPSFVQTASPLGVSVSQSTDGDPREINVAMTGAPSAVVALSKTSSIAIPVDSISNLPNAWSPVTYDDPSGLTNPPYHTSIQPMLLGKYNDDLLLQIVPSAVSNNDSNLTCGGPSVTGYSDIIPNSAHASAMQALYGSLVYMPSGLTGCFYCDQALPMQYALEIRSNSVCYAIKYAVTATTLVSSNVDTRNWDFSQARMDAVTQATDSLTAAREYYFDGSEKMGTVILDAGKLHGFGVGVRAGLQTLVPFRRPMANENVAATLTSADMPTGYKPQWTVMPDGVANVAEIDSDISTIVVQEARSIGRYGQQRRIKINMDGVPFESAILWNPTALAATVLQRLLYLWNVPIVFGRIPVALSRLLSAFGGTPLYHGDFITISDFMMPNPDGSRGWSARTGMVIGREIDTEAGMGWLEVIIMPAAYGYSPCVRVGSVGLNYIDCSTNYIDGTSDYAAGQDAVGGASFFNAGDRVEIFKRDVTTYGASDHDSLIVDHVTTNRIFFTTNVPTSPTNWGTYVSGGGLADLRYDRYTTSGLQAAQKKYAWCGSRTAGVIDGTADKDQEWSP